MFLLFYGPSAWNKDWLIDWLISLSISHIIDQRRILFWRKLQASSHVLLQLLASLCVNEHIAVCSRYGIPAANVSMHYVKCCVWTVFEHSVVSVSRSPFGQQIPSDSSDDYWKLTTSSCISAPTSSAVTVFNLVFTLHTFYDYCNASRSGFVYRGH